MQVKNVGNKPVILFFFPNISSFVKKDLQLLSEDYQVLHFEFNPKQKWMVPFAFLRQFVFLLKYIGSSRLYICQLSGYHSVLPVMFSKVKNIPSLIFAAGTDCANIPSIAYGNFTKKLLGFATSFSFRHATHLAPKHQTLISYHYTYDNIRYQHQGLKGLIRNFQTPYTVIHNGYDPDSFKKTREKIPASFITVAAGIALPNTIALKGIDLVLKAAASLPDAVFTIIGVPSDMKISELSNVHTYPELSHDQLEDLYSTHAFYLQLSMSEGFPNAVCEAMLCECIPITSPVNALEEINGGTGYLLEKRDAELLIKLLRHAIDQYDPQKGELARQHIIKNFPLEKRKQKLQELIAVLLSERRSD